jgi:NAD(P) transhydrogenase subunit alpha
MYASNLVNLVSEFYDQQANSFALNLDDDILNGCVITTGGAIVNQSILSLRNQES